MLSAKLRGFFRVSLWAILVGVVVACTPENPDNNNNNSNTNATQEIKLQWTFRPEVPLPGLAADLDLSVLDSKGSVVQVDTLSLIAVLGDKRVAIPLSKTEQVFSGKSILLEGEGEWELQATIEVDGTTQVVKHKVMIKCDHGGAGGAGCCKDEQCGDGLSCVFGSCRSELEAGKGRCYEGNDCASQVCENSTCLEGSCNDGSLNGRETDVDCGGACGPCTVSKSCGANADCKSGRCHNNICSAPPGALLGSGDGSPESVNWTVISDQGMSDPTSLAFHPNKKNELWITNRVTDSFTVVTGTGEDGQAQRTYLDRSEHFMEEVMTLAFDGEGYVGTCMDSTNTYGGRRAPNYFMGPATWPDNANKFAQARGGSIHVTHLDMLHSSPRCMGIAAAGKHTFFAVNGMLGTIDWYDFGQPHVPGGSDHSDGVKRRYYSPKLTYVKGVPSSLVYDKPNKSLFIADAGSGRILRLDLSAVSQREVLNSPSDYVFRGDGILYRMTGDTTEVVVPFPGPLRAPSGLLLHDDTLYVSDYKSGKLHAFDRDGKLLRSLDSDLGSGALSGIAVNPSDNKLYLVDRKSNRVLRVDPK